MWIMGKHFNNRAVSAVIATLLLIAIAVAAAIVVYVFSIGLIGGLQTSGGQQVKQQVIMEAYSWGTVAGPLAVTLRNVGPASVTFSDLFINGVLQTPANTGCFQPAPYTLTVGNNCIATVATPTPAGSAGVSYVVKIVTIDGAVFSFAAIAGSSS
jgi:flagellin-like protein